MTSKTVPDACVSSYACTNVSAAATRDVHYSYDLRGLPIAARFDSAVGSDAVINGYDGLGRLTSSTTSMAGVARSLGYLYDADGNRTRITHPDGTYFTYDYDGLNRPVVVKENGSTSLATINWDAQGRRSGEGRGSVSTTYGYDAISRLSSLSDDLTGTAEDVTTTFGYNPANQIINRVRSNADYIFAGYVNINRSYAANGLNQYASVGGTPFGYDSNGNLTSDGSIAYTYDAENRLVVTSAGANLTYDPTGRLFEVTKPTAGTTRFLYDGDQLAAEYDTSGTVLRRYVHGTGEDDPLSWYEGTALGDRRSLQIDHLGSVVSVADASGTALEVNAYDEYGIPDGGNIGRFQYTGQAWIPELGMYYYKARIYSPTLGRFLQTDPIGYDDQTNLYAYVANDPVNGTDPSGMARVCTSATGSRIPACVGVDGNGDGNYKDNDLSSGQKSAIAFAYHGAIIANRGRDLSGFGKPVSGTASAADQAMTRVASQFVGNAFARGGGALGRIWKQMGPITANKDVGLFTSLFSWRPAAGVPVGWQPGRSISISGHRGGLFNSSIYNPSDLARIMLHEPRHYLNGGVYLGAGAHLALDAAARAQLAREGLDGGGCQSLDGLPAC